MNNKLRCISQKINTIQNGLLRYDDAEGRITMHVTARSNDDNSLTCTVPGNTDLKKLINKRVNFIQKSENDYLYISGDVKERGNKKTVFINILKACWFVRKSKGTLSWLQEKHVYDISLRDDLELAS